MHAMIIDDNLLADIKLLLIAAEMNIISNEKQIQIARGELPPIGDDDDHVIYIPPFTRIVLSFDEHEDVIVKHISISYKGKLPSVPITIEILNLFEFQKELYDNHVSIEKIGIEKFAINIFEEINTTTHE